MVDTIWPTNSNKGHRDVPLIETCLFQSSASPTSSTSLLTASAHTRASSATERQQHVQQEYQKHKTTTRTEPSATQAELAQPHLSHFNKARQAEPQRPRWSTPHTATTIPRIRWNESVNDGTLPWRLDNRPSRSPNPSISGRHACDLRRCA